MIHPQILDALRVAETLSVHRPAYALETLSSWATGLAQDNGAQTRRDVHVRLGFVTPKRTNKTIITDVAPLRVDLLCLRGATTADRVRAMTFHHLVDRFGRAANTATVAGFMRASVRRTLAYCPRHLARQRAYLLPWRLRFVDACPEAGCRCRLVEACPHCHQPIPLFQAPFRLGYCPLCGGDLADMAPLRLRDDELAAATERYADAVFLLQPPRPREVQADDAAARIGTVLAERRKDRGLTRVAAAAALGITPVEMTAIERGDDRQGALSLDRYVAYADLLGMPLRDIVQAATEASVTHPRAVTEADAEALRAIFVEASEAGVAVPVRDAGARLGRDPAILRRSPITAPVLLALAAHNQAVRAGLAAARRADEDALIARALAVMDELEQSGEPMTMRRVCELVGIEYQKARGMPRLHEVLRRAADPTKVRKRAQFAATQRALTMEIARVRAALDAELGRPASQVEVLARTGRQLRALRGYPDVAPLLADIAAAHTAWRREQRTAVLAAREAVVRPYRAAVDAGQAPPSRAEIAAELGIDAATLQSSIPLGEDLRALSAARRTARTERKAALDVAWTDLLEDAARTLAQDAATARPLTKRALAAAMGCTVSVFRHYPGTRQRAEDLISANRG